jgi:quercetin 2,3-dioxygenase
MTPSTTALARDIVLVEDAGTRPIMGIPVLEPVPSPAFGYEQTDPFVLVHEAVVPITPEQAAVDTRHPHRGFDNLWYVVSGSASTGHTTGPGGSVERARLRAGSLLKIRTGRGVWHAEGIGEDDVREGHVGEMRGVLFWVNLARRDKGIDPSAEVLEPDEIPTRLEGGTAVRTLVGDGSPIELGTPALILDVEVPVGGTFETEIDPGFNAFVWVLDGEADFGTSRRRVAKAQVGLLGRGSGLTVTDGGSGTRFLLMAGKPYGETPVFNGSFVD